MRYTGIQPQYFPRLHYFARILATDVFVLRDDVQFVAKHKYPDGRVDKSYQAHTPIKQAFGRFLLGVPVKHDGYRSIKDSAISYELNWIEVHLKTLQIAYGNSPHFDKIYPEIDTILSAKYETFNELNTTSIYWGILRLLGRSQVEVGDLTDKVVRETLTLQKTFRLKEIRHSSKSAFLAAHPDIGPNEKIVGLIKEVGADEDFCGGTSVAAYVDHELFASNGITITVQDWKCQQYPQQFTKQQGFLANLSIIDLLMNVSTADAVNILA